MAKFLFRLVLNAKTKMRPIFSNRYETILVNKEVILYLKRNLFPSPQKPTFPNSNLTSNQVDEEPLIGCATAKSLFIYLFIYLFLFYLPGIL